MGRRKTGKRKGVTIKRLAPDTDDDEKCQAPAPVEAEVIIGSEPGLGTSRAIRSQPSPLRPLLSPTLTAVPSSQPRRRGRPRKNLTSPSKSKKEITVQILSFPVTEGDDELLQCAKCSVQMSSSAFRLHNITSHYNLAKTTNDPTVEDRKFYERKLRELAKLKNISTFFCPQCSTRYKSTLGLAYHLEACGKSNEEIESLKVPCDICQERFLVPNLAHHKKSQHGDSRPLRGHDMDDYTQVEGRRKSAVRAREVLKEMEAEGDNNEFGVRIKPEKADQDWDSSLQEGMEDDGDNYEHQNEFETFESNSSVRIRLPNLWRPGESKHSTQKESIVYGQDGVITWDSIPFDASGQSENEKRHVQQVGAWDSPLRNYADQLEEQLRLFEAQEQENKLEKIKSKTDLLSYLPPIEKSIEFCTKTLLDEESSAFHSTDYKRLNRFDSELIESEDFNFIGFVGGSIKSMAWHPSGSILALSTCRSEAEDPNVLQPASSRNSILIYCQKGSDAAEASFSLELIVGLEYGYVNELKWDNFWPMCADALVDKQQEVRDAPKKIGYLACAMEDSTIRILSLNIDDFRLPPTYPHSRSRYRVYKKTPEVTLSFDESNSLTPGHCLCFDWHEHHKFIIAGYGSGHVAVFSLATKSSILKNEAKLAGGQRSVTIHPIWLINAHALPVRSIVTDPANPRFFCSGSMDRYVKTWDMELREEIENKYIGSVIDMCWIRGWMHTAISSDLGLGYGNANVHGNFVRFYAIGNSKGVSNYMDVTNVSSVDFCQGMLAQGTELGKVSATYYDAYWREGDYDRNKKKKNYSLICNLSPDEDSIAPLTTLTRTETVETLAHAAEAYQRNFEPKSPKFVLSITKDRSDVLQVNAEPPPEQMENMVRCHNLLKISKVAWCPTGVLLATGYKNGLLVITEASFERLFMQRTVSRGRRPISSVRPKTLTVTRKTRKPFAVTAKRRPQKPFAARRAIRKTAYAELAIESR